MTVERLETERLELAKPKPSDWPAFRDFYMFERADYIRDPEPNLGKAWRTLASEIGHWDMRG
ncbi:MAG: N-acetyltransferase, partial [Pseudomonadota bacterium]